MNELTLNITVNGSTFWYKNDPIFSSEFLPVTYNIEKNIYHFNCCFHREDGPAIEWANGDKEWWINGIGHREGGPTVEYHDGSKYYYLNGKLHRNDGPAIEHPCGRKEWYLNGLLHREDGPASEYPDGTIEWWYNGVQYNVNSVEELMIAVLLK